MYKPFLDEIIGEMRKSISQKDGGTYLDQISYISSKEGILTLGIPSKFFKDKIESLGLKRKIEEALEEKSGSKVQVVIEIKSQDVPGAEPAGQKKAEPEDKSSKKHPDLKEEFTFQLQECAVGDGTLDVELFAQLATRENPDMPMIIEHLTTDEEYINSFKYVKGRLNA